MLSQDVTGSIIAAAILAPSGENKQPWRFVVEGNKILIFNLPERDRSLYNAGQIGSFVAHGCLLENVIVAASAHGYSASVELFPDQSKANLVASVTLVKNEVAEDSLYPFIQTRSTNRKAFKKEPIIGQQKDGLKESIRGIEGADLLLVDGEQQREAIGHAVSLNEKILFENEYMHRFFFGHITWNEKEDQEKRMGLYIKTLELKPPQRIAFSVFKHWNILKRLNSKGSISQTATKENAKLYASCAAFGAIVISERTPSDFVTAGRAMERVWLTATKMGLSLQVTAGGLFLMHGYELGGIKELSSAHVDLIKQAYADIQRAFNVDQRYIVMVFRVGKSDPPSARSVRLDPDILIKREVYA